MRRSGSWWWGLGLDLRHAFRGLRRRPGAALGAMATLALGIGSATLVASLATAVLVDPLPYPESHRLVDLRESHDGRERRASPAGYLDWRRELRSFTDIAAYRAPALVLETDGRPTREEAGVVSGNFFRVLGVAPALGRTFDPSLRLDGAAREIVLGHGLWSEQFGGRADVLGLELQVDGETSMVVGVMPPGFAFPEGARLWVRAAHEVPPAGDLGSGVIDVRDAWYFDVVGRLAPGVSLEDARRDARSLSQRLLRLHPEHAPDQGLVLRGLKESTVADGRPILLLLLGAVALVVAATCANVAALALIRSVRERRELMMRAALGASDWRRARLVILRTLLVSGAGGVLGVGLALLGLPVLRSWLPASVPRLAEFGPSPTMLAVALGATLLATLASALLPAWSAATARDRPSGARDGAGPGASSSVVVAVEVALATVLLSSTGLLARSVAALAQVDPGFRAEGLVTLRAELPGVEIRAPGAQRAEWRNLVGRAGSVSGVSVAALAAEDPVSLGIRATLRVDGPSGPAEGPDVAWRPVTPDWFEAVETPLLRGRRFGWDDVEGTRDVAVVDEALARAAFGEGVDPLGRRVTIGIDGHDRPLTIVGVVAATRNQGGDRAAFPVLYRPLAQVARPPTSWTLAVRVARGAEAAAVPRLRQALEEEGGALIHRVATGDDLLRRHGADRRFLLRLLGVFAGFSLLLGAVGMYAVTAGMVSARTRELGVRRAIGADARSVISEVLARGGRPILVGLVAGLAGAVGAGQGLRGLLYGVAPVDALTLAVVTGSLALTAMVALAGPAMRAARVDPMVALREE